METACVTAGEVLAQPVVRDGVEEPFEVKFEERDMSAVLHKVGGGVVTLPDGVNGV